MKKGKSLAKNYEHFDPHTESGDFIFRKQSTRAGLQHVLSLIYGGEMLSIFFTHSDQ